MTENKMKDVAQLVGLELEEEFRMDNYSTKYKLTKNGFMYWSDDYQQWNYSGGIEELLIGRARIVKLPKPILDDVEKEYLSNIIKPFRNKVEWIKKVSSFEQRNLEYIKISYQDTAQSVVLSFPDFKVGTMYRGMKIGKSYTLKELGL